MLNKLKQNFWPLVGVLSILGFAFWGYFTDFESLKYNLDKNSGEKVAALDFKSLDEVLPEETVIPVNWNNLGKQMVENGVIDKAKFEEIYQSRGGLTDEQKNILFAGDNSYIKMTQENSGFWLNVLWGFGLANKNEILENGPMSERGSTGNFASTGGWSLAKDKAMNHYSKHQMVVLTPEQQKRVVNVSQGIYRPCCGNSTYFPDCNHGMAMLGLLEILAANDFSEEQMFQVALKVNAYWFPDTYLTIAKYFKEKENLSWSQVDPKLALGESFSSSFGYTNILKQVEPAEFKSGGSCGV
ncbi:MAG: hypothetical protein UX26_C0011G0008 [Parcubacteria group bacterium GW2011_GWC1_45_9]|nr:MAG: hypothetical protein UW85_C0003G0012 [Parcubacteria group bacterium GW2011_GWA1_Parcubacteria_45_10]KKU16953.1 MAG: hypothetical protein UX26_C0011G0008 [Parcubacteria group bacterium GW2011_GWC1_45_9]